MSKGNKLNGFAMFMKERRRSLEAEGLTFPGGLKDVAVVVDKEWRALSAEKKDFYKQRAKSLNTAAKVDEGTNFKSTASTSADGTSLDLRKTSFGVMLQEIEDEQSSDATKISDHNKALRWMLENSDPQAATFIIINFSTYGGVIESQFIPAEVALTAFNVMDGIKDNFCTLVDSFEISNDLEIEAHRTAVKLGVPYPPFDNRCQDYKKIVKTMENFIDKHTNSEEEEQRKVYCLTREIKIVEASLDWLYAQLEKKKSINVYSFGTAMKSLSDIGVINRARASQKSEFEMVDELIKEQRLRDIASVTTSVSSGKVFQEGGSNSFASPMSCSNESDRERIRAGIFENDEEVDELLGSLNHAFEFEIGCPYHCNLEVGIEFCALNVTNRYAYNILDILLNMYSVKNPVATFHFPDLPDHPVREFKRRQEMLNRWGTVIFSKNDFKYDGLGKIIKQVPSNKLGTYRPC